MNVVAVAEDIENALSNVERAHVETAHMFGKPLQKPLVTVANLAFTQTAFFDHLG